MLKDLIREIRTNSSILTQRRQTQQTSSLRRDFTNRWTPMYNCAVFTITTLRSLIIDPKITSSMLIMKSMEMLIETTQRTETSKNLQYLKSQTWLLETVW